MSSGVFPRVAPCSGGSVPEVAMWDIILRAKITFNHQLKSASNRHIARSFSMLELPAIFSRSILTPLHHLVRGSPLVVARFMFVVCSLVRNGSSVTAL